MDPRWTGRTLDMDSTACGSLISAQVPGENDNECLDHEEDDEEEDEDVDDQNEEGALAAATFDIDKDEERENGGGDHGGLHSRQHYH